MRRRPAVPKGSRPPRPERQAGGASRFVLFVVAPLTLVAVGLSLFVIAAPRPFVYARLWGGPTDAGRAWTGRVQLVERRGGLERPAPHLPIRIQGRGPMRGAAWSGRSDEDGWAEVRLERPKESRRLDVCIYAGEPEERVGCGEALLTSTAWRGRARERSGQMAGRREGELAIEVTVLRGVLAVPFPGELRVTVQNAEGPVSGAELTWRATGLTVFTRAPLRTDGEGSARLRVAPEQHVVSLEVRAVDGAAGGSWYSTLPVVPGAMQVDRKDGSLEVRSPIERESAWYTWVSASERLGGGKLALSPTPFGSVGTLALPLEVPAASSWVVISSEPDGRSPSAVGWPLGQQAMTFDVAEAGLLDGAADGEAREELFRRRVRWGVSACAALAALLTAAVFLREARGGRDRVIAGADAAPAEEGALRAWVAVACVVLGFATITLIGLLWIR